MSKRELHLTKKGSWWVKNDISVSTEMLGELWWIDKNATECIITASDTKPPAGWGEYRFYGAPHVGLWYPAVFAEVPLELQGERIFSITWSWADWLERQREKDRYWIYLEWL